MTTNHPQVRRSAAVQKKFDDAMRELWEGRISFNKLLGLKVLSLDPADVRARAWTFGPSGWATMPTAGCTAA
jgi:hypothetical protein